MNSSQKQLFIDFANRKVKSAIDVVIQTQFDVYIVYDCKRNRRYHLATLNKKPIFKYYTA